MTHAGWAEKLPETSTPKAALCRTRGTSATDGSPMARPADKERAASAASPAAADSPALSTYASCIATPLGRAGTPLDSDAGSWLTAGPASPLEAMLSFDNPSFEQEFRLDAC